MEKLINTFSLDPCLVGWILDFLTNISQCVKVNETMSSLLSTSTGSPQGCVLSALLFILYTDDCRSNHDNRFIIKYADDSVIVSLLNNDEVEHAMARSLRTSCPLATRRSLSLTSQKQKSSVLTSDVVPMTSRALSFVASQWRSYPATSIWARSLIAT